MGLSRLKISWFELGETGRSSKSAVRGYYKRQRNRLMRREARRDPESAPPRFAYRGF